MFSCWHDLLFLFCLLVFYLFLPSMGWLCGVGVFGLIECPHSLPALHCGLQNNNNNNKSAARIQFVTAPTATHRWGGGLVWESVCKADLPSDHIDSNRSRESAC